MKAEGGPLLSDCGPSLVRPGSGPCDGHEEEDFAQPSGPEAGQGPCGGAKNVAGVLPIIVGLLIATGRYLFALRSSQMGTDSSAKTPVGRSYLAWRFSLPLTS
jgi:hypothetical protein